MFGSGCSAPSREGAAMPWTMSGAHAMALKKFRRVQRLTDHTLRSAHYNDRMPVMRRREFPALVGLPLLLLGTALWAQQTTADVLGTVTDMSGGVLPGVRITVHNLAMAADYTATSDNAGNYTVTLLPVGRYAIKAVAPGFK